MIDEMRRDARQSDEASSRKGAPESLPGGPQELQPTDTIVKHGGMIGDETAENHSAHRMANDHDTIEIERCEKVAQVIRSRAQVNAFGARLGISKTSHVPGDDAMISAQIIDH